MNTPHPTHYVAAPASHGRTQARLIHRAFEPSNAGLMLDVLNVEVANPREEQVEPEVPDGLVIAEPSWFPGADASLEEARRWLDEFSCWALSDDDDNDDDEESYC